MKIYKILYLSFLFIFFSCDGFNEEIVPISVNVEDVESILVINGEIEEGKIAWVQISYSEDIDASISSPINYEINASVSITKSDGSSECYNLITALSKCIEDIINQKIDYRENRGFLETKH